MHSQGNVLRVVQNENGKRLRVEWNGARLPIPPGKLDLTRDFSWAAREWTAEMTLYPDDVELVTETQTVDADPSPSATRLIEKPSAM